MDKPKYSIAGLEKIINSIVGFIFYYRMVFVLIFIIFSVFICFKIEKNTAKADEIKNLTFIVTCTSVTIGIFYTILNYEHNQLKARTDKQSSKLTQSYSVVSDWHKPAMVEYLKLTKKLYIDNKHLIDEGKAKDFYELLEGNDPVRAALISIFNYLECITIGIEQGILDECFIKKVFKTLFISYFNDYFFYISYKRKVNNTPTAWICFTGLAKKWQEETSQ